MMRQTARGGIRVWAAIFVAFLAVFAVIAEVNGGDSFRIMTYNIRHGTPSDNAHIDLAATAAAIAAESPDFVCLQEVDRNQTRSGNVDQAAYLAEAAGLGYSTFCKSIGYADGGEYGIALLSKTAPLSVTKMPLPRIDETYEQRMLLVCEFEDFYVATSHFDLNESPRLDSVDTISNTFATLSKPIFFTGDWNATPLSATLAKLKGFMTVISPESGVATFGSGSIIDYIAVDSAHAGNFVVSSSYVRQVPDVSDHHPVIAKVVRRPDPAGTGSDVWYNGNGVVVFGIGAASVAYRSESETSAWLDITVAAGNEATLTALNPDPSVTLALRKLGDGALALTNACGGFADLHIVAGSAILASTADVPGTTYLAGGELVAATNFTAGALVFTADSAIRVLPGYTLSTGKNGSYAALQVAGHTLSKFGDGTLNFANPVNASGESGSTYIVEEGTLQVCGDCWGGHSANASGYTLVVHENGTVTATTHVPLPSVVMRGGRFDGYITSIFSSTRTAAPEQSLRIYKGWAFKHMFKVLASTNGTPSVVSSYACHIGHTSHMPTFDIDAGAELQLDTLICTAEQGSGVPKASGFTKTGAGTLTFLRGGSLTGTTTLKEGTLKFAAGASLGPDATLNTYAGTTIELADGAAFETPISSSLSFTAAEYDVLTNCAIWVDAWQETAADGASVPTIANRGTVKGSFAPPASGSYKDPCTFTANGVNGRPSYRFNGSNQSMVFSDLAYGTANDPKHEMMIFVAFERKAYVRYYGFFSFTLSSNTKNDNSSPFTLYQEDDDEANFGLFNRNAKTNSVSSAINPTFATNGAPCVLSYYSSSSARFSQLDYIDGGYHQNANNGTCYYAFDRMAFGARMNASQTPRNPWNGAIGEMIVCTNYSAATYATLQAYMKRKWHSGEKGNTSGGAVVKVPQGTAAISGLADGRTPLLTKTGAGELAVGSVPADGDIAVTEGAFSLIPTSVVAKVDVWMDAADENTLEVVDGEVVSVRNKGRAGGRFVKNPRAGVSSTVSPGVPLLAKMNGHAALGFDGTRALVLDSYTNHNDDATYTVFVAARVGDDVDFNVGGKGQDASPFSLSSISSSNFDYQVPVGCHFEPRGNGAVNAYCDINGRLFGISSSGFVSLKAGAGVLFAHYNYNYGALAYLQTFTNGVSAEAISKAAGDAVRPYPAAIDVVSVGGRLGPKGTSYYYGSASTGRLWRGEVGELIVCTRQPTEDERAAILAYLRAKWFTSEGDATPPAAIAQPIVPSLGRNVKMAVSGGAELKSFAATQPLSGLSVTGDATFTRGGPTAAAFDIAGDLLLPAGMLLRIAPGLQETADLFTFSGALNGPGTAWRIDAKRASRWSVETKPNVIRALYTLPGTKLHLR